MPEPLFRHLVVALAPLPRKLPPEPLNADDLQRVFADVRPDTNYQQFQFLPGGTGATMFSAGDDRLIVQPQLVQLTRRIESTAERTRETSVAVLRSVEKRLMFQNYTQCGIKVVAHVPPPAMADAKAFVADRLIHEGSEAVQELGPMFFAGGIKFRSAQGSTLQELNVEPLMADNTLLYVDYDVQRSENFAALEPVTTWIDEAFDFVRGPAMRILST